MWEQKWKCGAISQQDSAVTQRAVDKQILLFEISFKDKHGVALVKTWIPHRSKNVYTHKTIGILMIGFMFYLVQHHVHVQIEEY